MEHHKEVVKKNAKVITLLFPGSINYVVETLFFFCFFLVCVCVCVCVYVFGGGMGVYVSVGGKRFCYHNE